MPRITMMTTFNNNDDDDDLLEEHLLPLVVTSNGFDIFKVTIEQ